MGAIFISYRREDSEGHAGRLFEDLVERFGKGSVFIDVTGIEPGRDFRKVIDAKVGSCSVLLALIGNRWLAAKDPNGVPRLEDPADFVRLETASALKRDIPVIPVLVHGGRMPTAEQLPPDLEDLAFRNAVELTHARWESDVQVLIDALTPHVGAPAAQAPSAPLPPPPSTNGAGSRRTLVAAIAGVVAVSAAAGAYHLFSRTGPGDDRRDELAQLVAQLDAPDTGARKAATTRLIREFGASPAAIGLAVEQLSDTRFPSLSREGRVNVFTYLHETSPSAWREADRKTARAAIARIRQRVSSGSATLGPQVLQAMDKLEAQLGA
jgi:hypothetical protein